MISGLIVAGLAVLGVVAALVGAHRRTRDEHRLRGERIDGLVTALDDEQVADLIVRKQAQYSDSSAVWPDDFEVWWREVRPTTTHTTTKTVSFTFGGAYLPYKVRRRPRRPPARPGRWLTALSTLFPGAEGREYLDECTDELRCRAEDGRPTRCARVAWAAAALRTLPRAWLSHVYRGVRRGGAR